MRFLRRSLTGLSLLAVTVALLALAGQTLRSAIEARSASERPQTPARERVYAVNVVPVTAETVAPVLKAFGEVRARRELEVRVQTGGSVLELGAGFEEGGSVEAGQLLLRIDPTELESALALASANREEAEAEATNAAVALAIARDDLASAEAQAALRAQALARQRDLAARGVGTEAAVETAALAAAAADQAILSRRSALAAAEARVSRAESALARNTISYQETERRLRESEVFAAFAGRLTGVSVVEGRIVSPNEKVATLIDPDALEVSFRLSTAQHARLIGEDGALIKAEVTIRLAVAGIDLAVPGKIDREGAAVGENETGRLLFARFEGTSGFRPGDFVTVEIAEPPLRGVAALPASAIGGADTVLVLGENDRLEELGVEVLRRQGDTVLVRAGPLAGREVVAERTPVLGAGISVRAFRDDPSAQPTRPEEPEMIALDDARRARLISFVENNSGMPADARSRLLERLREPEVPASMVERLEGRMGG